MKKPLIALAVFAVLSAGASAKDGPSNNNGPTLGGNTTNTMNVKPTVNVVGHTSLSPKQEQAAVSMSGGNKLTNEGNNSQQQTTVKIDGNSYTYNDAKIPVNTAYAAPLAASNGTCFGSASGGAQGPGFGISFGKTLFDENCDTRYDAMSLDALGLRAAAQARLCQKPEIAAAMEAAGTPCPTPKKAASAPSGAFDGVKTSEYTGNDPIVKRRLGIN